MFLLLKEKLAKCIADAAGVPLEEAGRSIELPKGDFGDVASSICFSLAKKQRKNPAELAREVAGRLQLPNWAEYAKAEGPYVNFLLSCSFFSELLAEVAAKKSEFGKGKKKKGATIVEFPSVNPNKPWHIGHLRNALLGDSIARILEFSGEKVERTDYIDDLGLQVAQSFWSYLHSGTKPAGKLDLWLGEQYVEASRKFESDEAVQQEVRALLRKMEEGKEKEARGCRKLVEQCVAAQYETAFKFSIYHDLLIFESDIVRTIFQEGLALLKHSKAIVHENEGKNKGCWVAKMTSPEFAAMESPDKILIRSDGTATYTGKDVIFQLWKFGILKNDFLYSPFMRQPNGRDCHMSHPTGKIGKYGKAARVVNVIGMEQAYPQKVIREILLSMGYKAQAESSVHLAYEHVGLEDETSSSAGGAAEAKASARKFSGRQGTWMGYTADELYSEGLRRSEVKIRPEIIGEQRGKIATAVAAGAIRFSFLRTTPEKRITFRWDDALSLEGDSAPYAMYAHARAHKIFAKAGAGAPQALQLEQAEKGLLRKIMLFDWLVSESARQMRPHIVADYCIDLATLYNRFYNLCPVISCEDGGTKANRLAINFAALTVMKSSLLLLGIEPLEQM